MRLITYVFIIVLAVSCQKVAEDPGVFSNEETPQSEDDGRQSKTVNGYTVAVTYLPGQRIQNSLEELNNQPDHSLHFLMEIETDGDSRTGNFLYHDVYGVDDFKSNVNYFNFEIVNDVSVMVDDMPYSMVLSNMENTYTLDDRRKIHFVAVPPIEMPPAKAIQRISFVYDDSVLGIGKTKFSFQTEEIKTISNKTE